MPEKARYPFNHVAFIALQGHGAVRRLRFAFLYPAVGVDSESLLDKSAQTTDQKLGKTQTGEKFREILREGTARRLPKESGRERARDG